MIRQHTSLSSAFIPFCISRYIQRCTEPATAKIEELIDELREKYTIAIVTHSMQQAARVSQRTAYFHLGQLIEVNSTDKVFTTPEHQLTEAYITGRFG